MKRVVLLFGVAVGLFATAYAQQSVVEKYRPKGPVVQQTIISYRPKIEFGEEVSRDTLEVEHRFFNKRGQILYKLFKDGPKSEPNFSYVVFEYANGRLSKAISSTPRVSDDLKVVYEINDSYSTYQYDSQGRLSQEDIYSKDGTLSARDKYTYTANGYILNQYNSKGEKNASAERTGDTWVHTTSDGVYKRIYDSNERLIQRITTMSGYSWGLVISENYAYDKYGNVIYQAKHEGSAIKKKSPNVVYKQMPDGRVKASLENDYSQERYSNEIYYEYEYDSRGNWLKQTNTYDDEILIAEIKYAKSDADFNRVESMIAQYLAKVDSTLLKPEIEKKHRKEALRQAQLTRIKIEATRIDSLKKLRQEKLDIIELCRKAEKSMQAGSALYEKNPLLCSAVAGYIEKKLGDWRYSTTALMSAKYIGLDIVSKTRLQYVAATQLAAMKLMTEPELKQTLKEVNKMLKKAADYDARVAWWDSYMKAVNIYWHRSETERTQKRELVGKCAQTFNKITDDVHRKFSWVISTYVEDYLGLDELRVGNTSQDRFFNGGGSGVNDFQTVDDYDIQWLQNLLTKIEYVVAVVSKEGLEIERLQALFRPVPYSSHNPKGNENVRVFDSYIRGDLDFSLYKWSDYDPSSLIVE